MSENLTTFNVSESASGIFGITLQNFAGMVPIIVAVCTDAAVYQGHHAWIELDPCFIQDSAAAAMNLLLAAYDWAPTRSERSRKRS